MIEPITDWPERAGGSDAGAARFAIQLSGGHAGRRTYATRFRADRAGRYPAVYLHNRLWAVGATRVVVDCDDSLFASLANAFTEAGPFAHQAALLQHIYGAPLAIIREHVADAAACPAPSRRPWGEPRTGKHVGVDLGGSDAKVVALAAGELLFQEKRDWAPRSFTRGAQALDVVCDLAAKATAAAGWTAPDGIGISSAGIIVRDRIMASGIFSPLPRAEFDGWITPLAARVSDRFSGAPVCAYHDGDMTPLWAHVNMGLGRVLGLSLGTGLGAGFIDESGRPTGMLCEIGKAIVDMSPQAPEHIYNHTRGPALHYCSQNAVFRLAEQAGIALPNTPLLAEKLRHLQRLAAEGDAAVRAIFARVGEFLAIAIAEFHGYFAMSHVVLVGRVVSGSSGEIIIDSARRALADRFPALAGHVALHFPTPPAGMDVATVLEFGQAVAAAYASSMRTTGGTS